MIGETTTGSTSSATKIWLARHALEEQQRQHQPEHQLGRQRHGGEDEGVPSASQKRVSWSSWA